MIICQVLTRVNVKLIMVALNILFFLLFTIVSNFAFDKFNVTSSNENSEINIEAESADFNLPVKGNSRSPERRIFGGTYVKRINDFGYMVYVMRTYIESNQTHRRKSQESCGGSVLSPSFVLTAAHCVKKCGCPELVDDSNCPLCKIHEPEEFMVYAGNLVAGLAEARSKVKQIHVHPEHKYVSVQEACIHRFDMAILEIFEPFKLGVTIKAVRLPKPIDSNKDDLSKSETSLMMGKRKMCKTIGWGTASLLDDTPYLQERLKTARVPLIKVDECRDHLDIARGLNKAGNKKRNICFDSNICTKSRYDKNGICHGDSGGPLVCGGVQIGVSSWGITGCVGPHKPSVFSRIDTSVKWIREIAY